MSDVNYLPALHVFVAHRIGELEAGLTGGGSTIDELKRILKVIEGLEHQHQVFKKAFDELYDKGNDK